MAERLARGLLDDVLGASAAQIGTMSAGTDAVEGAPMNSLSADVLRDLRGEPDGVRAQQLTRDMARDADLVLTMTRRQREAVLHLAPRALARTFTLREAADLVFRTDTPPLPPTASLTERGRALVAAMHTARPGRPGTNRDGDDIADPYGKRVDAHEKAGRDIYGALIPLLRVLFGTDADAAHAAGLRVPRAA